MNQLLIINSHKDVEKIINELEGFRLYENFMDERGRCWMGGEGEPHRISMQEPHEPSGQIYRPIWDNQYNSLGFVKYDGKTHLSVHFKDGLKQPADFEDVVKNYCALKNHLSSRIAFTSDDDFERTILRAACKIDESDRWYSSHQRKALPVEQQKNSK
ncbi:MAG: hypothetical protein AABX16_01770 [Nanoarchaeota archaeon]